MKPKLSFVFKNTKLWRLFLIIAAIAPIFYGDAITDLEIAVSVLYIAVVLMSALFYERRGVLIVALVCLALTIINYVLNARGNADAGMINTAISLAALCLTTYLALQIQAVTSTAKSLAETNELRDALIGSVSHELRTPLATILGGTSILATAPEVAKNPRLASLIDGIRDEAIRLNADIQNLLDAARIESRGLQARRDWTDPTDFMTAAVERIRSRFPHHKIEMSYDKDLPLLSVDPVLMEQALGQIIANAVKFSHSESTIHISAKVENRQLAISVHDEGVGVIAAEKERLGERFYRGPRHIGKIPGSGLGLWIANTFITSNGGRLEALSLGEGRGTTIKITFPIIA